MLIIVDSECSKNTRDSRPRSFRLCNTSKRQDSFLRDYNVTFDQFKRIFSWLLDVENSIFPLWNCTTDNTSSLHTTQRIAVLLKFNYDNVDHFSNGNSTLSSDRCFLTVDTSHSFLCCRKNENVLSESSSVETPRHNVSPTAVHHRRVSYNIIYVGILRLTTTGRTSDIIYVRVYK